MSKLRPILFSTAMVQAILDGRKTQTRRVVKPQPEYTRGFVGPIHWIGDKDGKEIKCPYGEPGDILWVRETWCPPHHLIPESGYVYKADDNRPFRWKPSIHMPFAAARIFLRVKSVRVERLHDISEADVIAEGIKSRVNRQVNQFTNIYATTDEDITKAFVAIQSFCSLWESINGPESWDANPWVWVVEFERISREEALA